MAYRGRWGTFVHIPKCGGLSIRNWLDTNFGVGKEVGDYHGLPLLVEDSTFTIIREPISWLASVWAYRLRKGWGEQKEFVYNWPVIVAMTKWLEKKSWDDFVSALWEFDFDIVMNVYGLYNHPKVEVYKLEELDELQNHFGVDAPILHMHKGNDLPTLTHNQTLVLQYVCRASREKYGYSP